MGLLCVARIFKGIFVGMAGNTNIPGYKYYSAATPGFSYFAITGKANQTNTTIPEPSDGLSVVETPGIVNGTDPDIDIPPQSQPNQIMDYLLGAGIITGILILIIVSIVLFTHKKKPLRNEETGRALGRDFGGPKFSSSKETYPELEAYIRTCRQKGHYDEEIRGMLISQGWPSDLVESHLRRP
jgi:hypothetical protein